MLNWSRSTIRRLVVNLLGESSSTFSLKPAFDPGADVTAEEKAAAGKQLDIFKNQNSAASHQRRRSMLGHVLALSTVAAVGLAGVRLWRFKA